MNSDSNRYCFPNLLEAFLIVVVLNMIEYLMNSIIWSIGRGAGLQTMAIASIGRVLANGLVFTVLLYHGKWTYRNLLHDGTEPWRVTLGRFLVPALLITPGLLLVMSVLEVGVGQFFPLNGSRAEAREFYVNGGLGLIVLTCLIAPLVEEMLFRGVMLRSFLRQYPSGAAIAHSAAVFGLAHLNVHQFVLAFGLGLLIGKLYAATRSLLPGILIHACYNTAVVIVALKSPFVLSRESLLDIWPISWWFGALVSGSAGAWLLVRSVDALRIGPANKGGVN
ncbi:CPBP family intramembrane glutamic endopeptidase [Burkholderia seminalis]|uniref:CPBP family intramembrane glutamic endopeptidase n=1 Tax=Burkholderia seminalis TaxID=488731 RepID=UPI0014534C67|nr:type II CAAX endopeptidase family protein [Burkholderia seminalis]MCA8431251.1 CPBP family intramembrane metalloprotease [Burkholderia seminalis]VWC03209.1 membrane protein [Burkholderia seminalis]